jgi:hypothetical protein
MVRHYKLQQQQLVQFPDNNQLSNQHLSQTVRFDGSQDKLRSFVSHLHMKLAGDASCFSNPQHQLQYTFELLVGQAFMQVEV